MNSFIRITSYTVLFSLFTVTLPCVSDERLTKLADIHLHWKWNQKEVTEPEEAIKILRDNNVTLAVVTGTPPELALELQQLAPDIVIPIYGIYQDHIDWSNWYHDNELVGRVRLALESGKFRGIGELHMISGFISDWKNPNISGLFELAAEFDVPILVHTEFSKADYLMGFCSAHPKTRFLWAHAGSILAPDEVARALSQYANLSVELSARDPWRHVGRPIDDKGVLKIEWSNLVIAYASRFMIGSDPVWPVEQLNPWDEPDTGWQELSRFLGFHREWLKQLPVEVAQKVRYQNAIDYFKREQ
ncbi:MAG: amidohydrolase [Candidatus Thiodiazotropha taylori]|nr:amidohydrolase [Candidatus Thiodiazotropha taylori]MCW4226604.1 amidohydrolase [Candidatus Thiodiazotropha endolucinida]MCG7882246.1 amidohydrolase [Candidatus Thiodiazotropha taylori]MCG7888166.1 amidohydrolase [Candidatus Thiodiazotropha taylori]MCG7891369.1 amidohydrolase [Candidatus Thiodiazotropha taylori]